MYIRTQFRRIIRFPRKMLWALFMEGVETKQMVHTYARHHAGRLLLISKQKQPTEEELQKAREQLRDIPRFLPFFVVIVVPAPGVTEGYAFLAVTLERWLGDRISLLPSQFRSVFQKEKTQPEPLEDTGPEKDPPHDFGP
ncbi:MAG: hypothetical protein EP344_09930 [Bacteroidetes bacterium]|nr:MAG: hypothetical protein EP344_09930 [Bacteroidota bacterium]